MHVSGQYDVDKHIKEYEALRLFQVQNPVLLQHLVRWLRPVSQVHLSFLTPTDILGISRQDYQLMVFWQDITSLVVSNDDPGKKFCFVNEFPPS